MRKKWISLALTGAMAVSMIGSMAVQADSAVASEATSSAEALAGVTSGATYGADADVNSDGTVNNPEKVQVNENNLVMWSLFTGGDGEWFSKIVNQYNSTQNPDHPVTAITLVWDDYYTKLQTAIATGNGPDIGISHVSKLYELAETGAIEPLDDYLKQMDLNLSDYYEQASIDAVTIDGHIFAIPLDTHAEVLYYNLDLLKQAGISEDDVKNIKSKDDFTALLKKCKDALPSDVSPLSITQQGDDPFRMWYADYFQDGGADFVNEDASETTIDEDKCKEVMEWEKSLYDDGLVLPAIDDHQALFQAGKAAFCITGTWATGVFEQTEGLNFNNADFPALFGTGDNQYCWADSHTLVLPVKKDRTDDESLSAAKFLFYASNDGGIIWAGSGQIPSAKKANQSDEYKQMKGYNVVDELTHAKYAPRTTSYYGGMKAEIIDALNGYWTGETDLDTAYNNVYTAIDNNLD